jgi:hypothetical protein
MEWNWDVIIEFFGICASILVAVSITIKNIKGLRIMNLIGSFAFALYGLFIGSIPVMVLNLFTAGVNVFYLFIANDRKPVSFDLMFVDAVNDEYTRHFLLHYGSDMARFFPSFNPDPETGHIAGAECCFILRETLPVSLVVFRRETEGEISILLDYAIPPYRDFRNARFFFETVSSRIARPGTVFRARSEVPAHAQYLRRMGFEEEGAGETGILFRKVI